MIPPHALEAARRAARFELRYAALRASLACRGLVPPSRDVVLEELRRGPDDAVVFHRLEFPKR